MDSGLASLAVTARFHGKAAEPQQLAHDLGLTGPARAEDLLRAAKRLELKATLGRLDVERAAKGTVPLPCIVELQPAGFAVLARIENGKALLHDPAAGRPVTFSLDELKTRLAWQGKKTSLDALNADVARGNAFLERNK